VNKDMKQFIDSLRSAAYLSNVSTSPPPSYSSPPSSFTSTFHLHNPIGTPSSSPPEGFLSSAYTAATGTISLEFFQRLRSTRSSWTRSEPLVWEVWTLKFNCLKDDANEHAFNAISIEDQLFDKMLSIVQIVNNSQYLPPMPSQSEVDNIFDTSFSDVQPYNFKVIQVLCNLQKCLTCFTYPKKIDLIQNWLWPNARDLKPCGYGQEFGATCD